MVRTEQLLIWFGVASLAWMSIFLNWGERLPPETVAFFSGEGTGVAIVLVLFLASWAGLALLLLNILRGRRWKLGLRLVSLGVYIAMFVVFAQLYWGSPAG